MMLEANPGVPGSSPGGRAKEELVDKLEEARKRWGTLFRERVAIMKASLSLNGGQPDPPTPQTKEDDLSEDVNRLDNRGGEPLSNRETS